LHEKIQTIRLDSESVHKSRYDQQVDGRHGPLPGQSPSDVTREALTAAQDFSP